MVNGLTKTLTSNVHCGNKKCLESVLSLVLIEGRLIAEGGIVHPAVDGHPLEEWVVFAWPEVSFISIPNNVE